MCRSASPSDKRPGKITHMAIDGELGSSKATGLRVVWVVAFAAYFACVLVGVGAWFVGVNAAEDSCTFADNGSGGGGVVSWSWFPLGQQCVYDLRVVDGADVAKVTHIDPPSPFVTTTVILLVAAPVLTWSAWKLGRRRGPGNTVS